MYIYIFGWHLLSKVAHLQGIYFTVCMFSGNQTQDLGIVSRKKKLP